MKECVSKKRNNLVGFDSFISCFYVATVTTIDRNYIYHSTYVKSYAEKLNAFGTLFQFSKRIALSTEQGGNSFLGLKRKTKPGFH